jgi:hypothetical protein
VDSAAVHALSNTHLAPCVSGVVWVVARARQDYLGPDNKKDKSQAAADSNSNSNSNSNSAANASPSEGSETKSKTGLKVSLLYFINGIVAGLAGITGCSGFVSDSAAAVIGLTAGSLSFFVNDIMKKKESQKYFDDALGVFPVHAVTSIVGIISVGIFADQRINCRGPAASLNAVGWQLLGVVYTVGYSATMTALIGTFLKWFLGIWDRKLETGLSDEIQKREDKDKVPVKDTSAGTEASKGVEKDENGNPITKEEEPTRTVLQHCKQVEQQGLDVFGEFIDSFAYVGAVLKDLLISTSSPHQSNLQ